MIGSVVFLYLILALLSAAVARNLMNNEEIPEQCTNKTFCVYKSANYPSDQIDTILDKLLEYTNVVTSTEKREGGLKESDCIPDISNQPIYEIIDENDNLRYVVQQDGKFMQIIRTETCMNPGRVNRSRYLGEMRMQPFEFECVERKMEYKFLVLSLDGTRFESVKIKGGLPVCCSCKMKNKY